MLGLADSDNYCHAAAFTSDNEIVVLEVVFGQFNLIERPPDLPDDTVGIFNWRRFSLKGKMIEEQYSVCQSMLTLFQSSSSPPNDILDGFNVNKFNLINKEFV